MRTHVVNCRGFGDDNQARFDEPNRGVSIRRRGSRVIRVVSRNVGVSIDTMQLLTKEPRWKQRVSGMDSPVEEINFPDVNGKEVGQDSEWCEVVLSGEKRRFRFHDYDKIYKVPGLYETLFYEHLKCCSPMRVASLLKEVLADFREDPARLRVLDLGAGNGMVGDELHARDVNYIVGVDIIPEAKAAQRRDRPRIYDGYFVTDLTKSTPQLQDLRTHRFNCLTSVAALGFGDIPPLAFVNALRLLETPGWLAFTIKEDFLYEDDSSGFCRLIRQLSRHRVVQMQAYRRFRHRLSISGEPLHYVAMVARKMKEVPESMVAEFRTG
jgi:SAM-dependent methyltransferase